MNFIVCKFLKVKRISRCFTIKAVEILCHKSVCFGLGAQPLIRVGYIFWNMLFIKIVVDCLLRKLTYQMKSFFSKFIGLWTLGIYSFPALHLTFCCEASVSLHQRTPVTPAPESAAQGIPEATKTLLKLLDSSLKASGLKLCESFIICSFYY